MKCSGRSAVVLLCNLCIQALTYGLATSMGVFYGEWKQEFQEQALQISWLATSVFAVFLASSPLSGAITRHFGIRVVILSGAILSASGLLAASLAKSIAVLFVTIPFMTGFGCSLAFSGSLLSVAQHFKKDYAIFNGIASAGCGAGLILWPLIFQVLIDCFSWRGAMLVIVGIQLHLVPLALILTTHTRTKTKDNGVKSELDTKDGINKVNEDFSNHDRIPNVNNDSRDDFELDEGRGLNRGKQCAGQEESTDVDNSVCLQIHDDSEESRHNGVIISGRKSRTIARRLRTSCFQSTGLSLMCENRVFGWFLLICSIGGSLFGTVIPHVVSVAKLNGASPIKAAFLMSVIGIAQVFSRATHGLLIKTGCVHQMMLFSFSYILAAVSVWVLPSAHSYPLMVVCASGVGYGSGIFIPMHIVIIRHMVPMHRFPGAVGMSLLSVCIGVFASSTVSGHILDQTSSYQLAFSYAGSMVLLSGVLVIVQHIIWNYCIIDHRWPPKENLNG